MNEQRIVLSEKFILKIDTLGNHWLAVPRVSKAGKQYEEEPYCGYHNSFEHLLDAYATHRLADKEAKTVKDILNNFAEVEDEIRGMAQRIGRELDKTPWRLAE